MSIASRWDCKKGDVLSFFTHNSIDTPALMWGCHWAGVVVAPSNPGSTAKEFAFQLKDSGAKGVVTQKSLLKVVQKAVRLAGLPKDNIVLVGDKPAKTVRFQHFSVFGPDGSPALNLQERVKIDPRVDLAFLCYSSGTTGLPKGVMLTHTNIIANVLQNRACDSGNLTWDFIRPGTVGQGDKVIGFLPFYHIYGMLRTTTISDGNNTKIGA